MVPLCTLLQALPVSFNGWGLREGLFALYFSQIGLPRASALAFSLVGAGLMVRALALGRRRLDDARQRLAFGVRRRLTR